jgi:molecular chaperone DnaJ
MVETPVKLSAEQKEVLRKFDESLRKDRKQHSPRQQSWLDGVKQFFENIRRSV